MHNVTYTRRAVKALTKIDATQAAAIVAKIDQYAADPASLANNVIQLKGSTAHRLRVGDYRVVFNVTFVTTTSGEMLVLDIGHRRDIYD